MASQGNEERYKFKLVPSIGEEPEGAPSTFSASLNVDSREFLDQHNDQAASQGPGSSENLESQDQNQSTKNVEKGNDVLRLPFPRKLWMIAENDKFKSVRWNDSGDTVIIEVDLFEREILHRRGMERFFETDSLKTFIQQLNLYGFSKICQTDSSDHSPGKKRMMIYCNSNFKRDNVLLLENIQRKVSFKNNAPPETSASTPKGKKQDTTKPSQGIQNSMNETIQNSQKKPPNVQGPSGSLDFMFSRTWSLSGVAGPPIKNCPPHQPNVPNREGTSQHAKPAPTATAEPTGAGAPPMGHTVYPDGASVMLLYNTCYSILLAALSVMSTNEPCDEQQESPSESLCEQFKDKPAP
ncbi:heat shock transcription factor, X-linked member 3-like [Tamandua tetradactyla]|uniref:heat shock transcription factor, X-linked member 3-like n=1 Tax=Tamandua tetradactyla TaxID=48850 RepID=UPI004053CC81